MREQFTFRSFFISRVIVGTREHLVGTHPQMSPLHNRCADSQLCGFIAQIVSHPVLLESSKIEKHLHVRTRMQRRKTNSYRRNCFTTYERSNLICVGR